MRRDQKEQVVEELTARLKAAETLLVADYRGLTMPQIDALRGRLIENGARLSVVKNTLTRRAAEAAGADALLALLDGPSAIAFLETGGDAVAVAKALAGLLGAPLQNLVGLIDARIEQLGGEEEAALEPEPEAAPEPEAEAAPAAEAPSEQEPAAEEESAEDTTEADATASAAEEEEES